MRVRAISLAALIAALSACGGADDAPEIALEFSRAELRADVKVVRVGFYQNRTCAALGVRGDAVLAARQATFGAEVTLSDAQQGTGGSIAINEIRAGTYNVAAYGYASLTDAPIAFGCLERREIKDGVKLSLDLTLSPL